MSLKLIRSESLPDSTRWVNIGAGWHTKSGKGISVVFGKKTKDKDGNLVEVYPSMVVEAGQQFFLFPTGDKKGNDKLPDFTLCIAEKSEETKAGEEESVPVEQIQA